MSWESASVPISFKPLLCEGRTLNARENLQSLESIHRGNPAYMFQSRTMILNSSDSDSRGTISKLGIRPKSGHEPAKKNLKCRCNESNARMNLFGVSSTRTWVCVVASEAGLGF
jgi:hypothetical protein